MARFGRFSTRRRVCNRLVTATLAGVIIAAGIGLGAHNAVWVAVLGCVAIVTGLALTPRPSRLTEMPQWELAGSSPGTRVQVESITRSAMNSTSVQPTSVTATVAPTGDTSYRTTWVTSMTKSYADAVLSSGSAKILDASVPPRPAGGRRTKPAQFSDYPGRWAIIYPAVTLAVCAAMLFGIPASAWHIDVSLSSRPGSSSSAGSERTTTTTTKSTTDESLQQRFGVMLGKIGTIAPTTVRTPAISDSPNLDRTTQPSTTPRPARTSACIAGPTASFLCPTALRRPSVRTPPSI